MSLSPGASPHSYVEAKARHIGHYAEHVASGQYVPFVWPFCAIGSYITIAYLLIPHKNRPLLRNCRYIVWLLNASLSLYCIRNTCAMLNVGYSVGLISAYSILWTAVLLVVNDAQADFCRLSRKTGFTGTLKVRASDRANRGNSAEGKSDSSSFRINASQDALQTRSRTSQHACSTSKEDFKDSNLVAANGSIGSEDRLIWQRFPEDSFRERVDWILDIFTQFRGIAWDWQLTGLPAVPKEMLPDAQTRSSSTSPVGKDGTRRYDEKKALLDMKLQSFLFGYVFLDVLKTITLHDSYFWFGDASAPAPTFLPRVIARSTILLRFYRESVSLLMIHQVLNTIFALGPFFFVGLLGEERIGMRGQAWMYPSLYGSFSNVYDKGLAGFWGSWWHQVFRFAFESISTYVIDHFKEHIVDRFDIHWSEDLERLLKTVVAFSLSGFLHGCGSYSQLSPTRPFRGPFLFFFLQPFGILIQMLFTRCITVIGIRGKTPKLVRQLSNLMFVVVWLYFTSPLLCDDFARGGLWMVEPVPFSILRGVIGLGVEGDGWWYWGGKWMWWHTGNRWWESGIAI